MFLRRHYTILGLAIKLDSSDTLNAEDPQHHVNSNVDSYGIWICTISEKDQEVIIPVIFSYELNPRLFIREKRYRLSLKFELLFYIIKIVNSQNRILKNTTRMFCEFNFNYYWNIYKCFCIWKFQSSSGGTRAMRVLYQFQS